VELLNALLVAVIIVCVVVMVYAVASARSDMDDLRRAHDEFMSAEHVCPECGWTGRVGLMNSSGQFGPWEWNHVTYYCPQCGYVLGVF
jgi:predicted RNA-binding Zn-ribbon protein involved in translation (DUF1610 family)